MGVQMVPSDWTGHQTEDNHVICGDLMIKILDCEMAALTKLKHEAQLDQCTVLYIHSNIFFLE